MSDKEKWAVGQQVYLRDINENRSRSNDFVPPIVTIEKVGRTLVYVTMYHSLKSFRKNDGRANDNYGHAHIQSFSDYEESQAILIQAKRLWKYGIKLPLGNFNLAAHIAIADLVERLDGKPND